MAVKASTQVSLVDITDAYNVILTSESYTFMGDSVGAPSGLSCTTQVVAYCGGSPCKVTVGNIICPSGITASVTSNGSVSPTITFRTTATVTASCEATIPVNVDGVTVNKKFSFAVAKSGDDFSWNLLKGSDTFTDDTSRYAGIIVKNFYENRCDAISTYEAWMGAYNKLSDVMHRAGIVVGDIVTYSVRVLVDFVPTKQVSFTLYRIGADSDGSNTTNKLYGSITMEKNKWYTISFTFTVTDKILNNPLNTTRIETNYYETSDYQFSADNSKHMYFAGYKLEKGSVATPWTPHPDDLKGDKGDTGATGPQGPQGSKGDTGKGISSTAITYQASSSGTAIPTGSWQSSVPSVSAGQYLWTRTVITYSDNTTSTSYSVGRMGTNGSNGSAGKGIKSTSVTYQAGASGTVVPTGTWSSSVPATSASAPYLWTRTIFTYTDNTTSTSYSVGSTPEGISVGGRNIFRQSGHWTEKPTWWASNGGGLDLDTSVQYMGYNTIKTTVGNGIIGNKAAFFELDTNKIYTYSALIKLTGDEYAGTGHTPLHYHCSSTANTFTNAGITVIKFDQTLPSGKWKLLYLTFKPNAKYFRPIIYIGSGTRVFNIAYLKLEEGNIATDWTPAPEDSIASVDVEYYLSTSATSLSGGSWSTIAPAWVNGKYMWSRTVTTDGAGNKTYSPNQNGVCIAGAKGETGATGATGPQGPTGGTGPEGKGIKSIIEQYYKSTSATSLSGGSWSNTYPGWENGKYIWTRSVTTYSDNTTSTTTAMCVTGMKGDKGNTGDTGKGVKSSSVTYQASSSGTAIPTGTWQASIPAVSEGSFLWTKTTITYTDNTSTTSYSVGKMGNNGSAGKGIKTTSITYQASSSSVTIPTGTWRASPEKTTADKPYFWTRTIITYTDNTTSTAYSVGGTIDGMQVGGRNLIIGTKNGNLISWANTSGITISGGSPDYKIFSVAAYNLPKSNYIPVKKGETYTFSTEISAVTAYQDSQFGVLIEYNDDNGERIFYEWITNLSFTTAWSRISKTIIVPDNDNIAYITIGLRSSAGVVNSFRYMKLEKGNIATDWTPAPEDVSYDIGTAAKTATNFMEFTSGTGLQIGDKINGSWKGFRTKITSTAFEILNEVGTVVASYGRKLIELGKDATDAVISLCGGKGIIKYFQIGVYGEAKKPTLSLLSENLGLIADDTVIIKSEQMDDDDTTYMSQIYLRKGHIDMATFTELSDGTCVGNNGISIDDYFGIDVSLSASNNETLSKIRLNGWTLLDYIHPVGSIYLAYNDSESPAEKFGGEWEQITGKFLYCDTGTASGGSTKHKHVQTVGLDYASGYLYANSGNKVTGSRVVTGQMCSYKYDSYGASAPTREDSTYESYHTPQYITVYAWRRTA